MDFIVERNDVTGVICFSGSLTGRELEALDLNHIERYALASPATTAADLLLSLEIIYRRHAEQQSEADAKVKS